MNEVIDFFSNIFETKLWPARWHCGSWSDFHGWLYIISDLMIWTAYFTIPFIILIYIQSRKKKLRFYTAYFWFAAFILACGFTHLLDASMFWWPAYRFNALARFATALISWLTVYHLIKMLPIAFVQKTSSELEEEVLQREELLEKLNVSHEQLIKQNEFIEKIVDSTADYVNVFDRQMHLISTNNTTQAYLKKDKSELIGKHFNTLFPYAVNSSYHQDILQASKGKLIKNKIVQAPNGLHYENSYVPLYKNDIQYGVLVVSRDVTEAIIRENRLEELNALLNTQNNHLSEVNVEMEQFTYILSHDLQEPLRKIQMLSNLIKDHEMTIKERTEYLSKIEGTAIRMSKLIKDVLDYSKIKDKAETWEDIDLNEVIQQVQIDLELLISKTGVTITCDNLPPIKGVQYQIAQLFYNLIGNSIKYNKQTPKISITHQVIRKADNSPWIEIKIADNGIGFEPEYKESIFDPFKRLHSKSEYEGTGIGLALVKKIVESHKGSVSAESRLNEGSVFTILFPVSTPFA